MSTGPRRRGVRSAASIAAACVALTGCARFGDPTAASPAPVTSVRVLQLGDETRTASGNVVRVHGFEFPLAAPPGNARLAAADIEACAGATAGNQTGVSLAFFRVELDDHRGIVAGAPVRLPALRPQVLAQGHCAQGWVTFVLAPGDHPRYVVFRGSSVVRWAVAS